MSGTFDFTQSGIQWLWDSSAKTLSDPDSSDESDESDSFDDVLRHKFKRRRVRAVVIIDQDPEIENQSVIASLQWTSALPISTPIDTPDNQTSIQFSRMPEASQGMFKTPIHE